jgi:hypothetical protein
MESRSGGGNEDVELEVPARYARVQNGAHGPGVVISRIKKPPQLLVATDLLTWYRVDGSEEMPKLSPTLSPTVAMWTWPVSVGVFVVVCVLYARERTRMDEVVGVVLI